MSLVAHSALPTFSRLREAGHVVLTEAEARQQDIRELHIGLLNMMPDAALEATERQFFRLIGGSNRIAQFHVHPFTVEGLPRSEQAGEHIKKYYEPFSEIQQAGLDALVITGANVSQPELQKESFWEPLAEVYAWARQHVPSVLCSCLATHALVQLEHGIVRQHQGHKLWGVYPHRVVDRAHPLVADINTRHDVPHSRYNDIPAEAMRKAGMQVLIESDRVGVHLATSPDGFRVVYCQGHPEYDLISLLKEYKREILNFHSGERKDYPPFPEHYFSERVQGRFQVYRQQLEAVAGTDQAIPLFPEAEVLPELDNTWRDSAKAVFNNWLGLVYSLSHHERGQGFMEGVDPQNPLA